MQELVNVLDREHVQLEHLLFKVMALQYFLRSGDTRFLWWAVDEIGRAGQRLHATEMARRVLVHRLSAAAGIVNCDGDDLESLGSRLSEPWRTIIADHGQGFRRLVEEVAAVSAVTRALAESSGHAVALELGQIYPVATLVIALPRDQSDRSIEPA